MAKNSIIPSTRNLSDIENKTELFPIIIPKFQRKYRWALTDHVEKYLEDIFNVFDDPTISHFFNSMVFVKGKTIIINDEVLDGNLVIDGQQRLITTILLLLAKRRLFPGSSFILKPNQFVIANDFLPEAPNKSIDYFDLLDIELHPEYFGFQKIEIKKLIDKKQLVDWEKILIYCLKNAFKNRQFLVSLISKFENLKTSTNFKDFENLIIADGSGEVEFNSNFEKGLKLVDHEKELYLYINAIIYIVKNEIHSTDDFLSGNNDLVMRIAKSILYSADDIKIRTKIKENTDILEIPREIVQWFQITKSALDQILSFFIQIDSKILLTRSTKTSSKDPYVSNYEGLLVRLAEKFNKFKSEIVHKNYILNDDDDYLSDNNLFSLFGKRLTKAISQCFFVEVLVQNDVEDDALDLALSAFMSINSTGEPLAAFDIIKSDLFRLCKSKEKIVIEFDDFIQKFNEKCFDKKSKEDSVLKFFFASKKREITKDDSSFYYQDQKKVHQYKDFIKNISATSNEERAVIFIENFKSFCENLNLIFDGLIDDPKGKIYSSSLHLCAKLSYTNETLWPVLHNILAKEGISGNDKKKIFNTLYFNFLRYLITAGSKDLTTIFAKILNKISIATDYTHIQQSIKDELKINIIEIENKFVNYTKSGEGANFYNVLGKHICILFEGRLRKDNTVATFGVLRPNNHLFDSIYTIEHIVPQSNVASSKSPLRFIPGNFTLLPSNLNSAANAKDFCEKIGYYLQSNLIMNHIFVQSLIDRYNKSKKPKSTDISKIVIIETSKPGAPKKKLKTSITNLTGDQIEGEFSTKTLIVDFIVGNWLPSSPNKISTVGARYQGMINLLINDETSFNEILTEFDTNIYLDLNTFADFASIS